MFPYPLTTWTSQSLSFSLSHPQCHTGLSICAETFATHIYFQISWLYLSDIQFQILLSSFRKTIHMKPETCFPFGQQCSLNVFVTTLASLEDLVWRKGEEASDRQSQGCEKRLGKSGGGFRSGGHSQGSRRQGLVLIPYNSYSWSRLEFLAFMILESLWWLCFGTKSQSGLRLDPKLSGDGNYVGWERVVRN